MMRVTQRPAHTLTQQGAQEESARHLDGVKSEAGAGGGRRSSGLNRSDLDNVHVYRAAPRVRAAGEDWLRANPKTPRTCRIIMSLACAACLKRQNANLHAFYSQLSQPVIINVLGQHLVCTRCRSVPCCCSSCAGSRCLAAALAPIGGCTATLLLPHRQ